MSTSDKYLKESHEYSAEDAKFMDMAIRKACAKLGTLHAFGCTSCLQEMG